MGRCLGHSGRKFHRGFVGIPTDLSSVPSICVVGYGPTFPRQGQTIH
ncbi:hypothetical protein [Leptospira weilii]|nr:hypothetical protein [Leptospira weilii]